MKNMSEMSAEMPEIEVLNSNKMHKHFKQRHQLYEQTELVQKENINAKIGDKYE